MISSIRGEVLEIQLDHVVIEVGGMGYAVQATPTTLATLRRGDNTRLHTMLIVREDSLTLFGFESAEARALFALLLTVSGIGPRIALAALAVLDPHKLTAALSEGNIAVLTQVPGIGRKGAERLTLELRDKVLATAAPAESGAVTSVDAVQAEVVEALFGLGFPTKHAELAVNQVLTEDIAKDTPTVLRAALATLGRKR